MKGLLLPMFKFLPDIQWQVTRYTSIEQALVIFIKSNDQQAFEYIFEEISDDLYHYLTTLSDLNLAQDISQKTWFKLIDNPKSFLHKHSLKAWLFVVARNALFDEFKKTDPLYLDKGELENKLNNNDQYIVEFEYSDNETEGAFNLALKQLSFTQKEAFCLQQDGFSIEDIANITNSNKETIKTRIRYAKQNLKKLLEQLL